MPDDKATPIAEMIAFIERIAAWDFDGFSTTLHIIGKTQREAVTLLKKIKGDK
jgi:hypothetical protein